MPFGRSVQALSGICAFANRLLWQDVCICSISAQLQLLALRKITYAQNQPVMVLNRLSQHMITQGHFLRGSEYSEVGQKGYVSLSRGSI